MLPTQLRGTTPNLQVIADPQTASVLAPIASFADTVLTVKSNLDKTEAAKQEGLALSGFSKELFDLQSSAKQGKMGQGTLGARQRKALSAFKTSHPGLVSQANKIFTDESGITIAQVSAQSQKTAEDSAQARQIQINAKVSELGLQQGDKGAEQLAVLSLQLSAKAVVAKNVFDTKSFNKKTDEIAGDEAARDINSSFLFDVRTSTVNLASQVAVISNKPEEKTKLIANIGQTFDQQVLAMTTLKPKMSKDGFKGLIESIEAERTRQIAIVNQELTIETYEKQSKLIQAVGQNIVARTPEQAASNIIIDKFGRLGDGVMLDLMAKDGKIVDTLANNDLIRTFLAVNKHKALTIRPDGSSNPAEASKEMDNFTKSIVEQFPKELSDDDTDVLSVMLNNVSQGWVGAPATITLDTVDDIVSIATNPNYKKKVLNLKGAGLFNNNLRKTVNVINRQAVNVVRTAIEGTAGRVVLTHEDGSDNLVAVPGLSNPTDADQTLADQINNRSLKVLNKITRGQASLRNVSVNEQAKETAKALQIGNAQEEVSILAVTKEQEDRFRSQLLAAGKSEDQINETIELARTMGIKFVPVKAIGKDRFESEFKVRNN